MAFAVMPAPSRAESAEYDAAGRVIRITTPDGQVVHYRYDELGNLRSVSANRTPRPPLVEAVVPQVVRAGTETEMLLSGDHLENAGVKPAEDLSLAVVEASRRTLRLRVRVHENATVGAREIRVFNDDGEGLAEIDILPPLPRIGVHPLPLALSDDGTVFEIAVRLTNADVVDRIVELSVSNSAFVELLDAMVTIPAGDLEASARLRGLNGGLASLALTSDGLEPASVAAYVTAEFEAVDTAISHSVGIQVGSSPATVEAPVVAGSTLVGVFSGPGIDRVEPSGVAAGAQAIPVIIEGHGLRAVDGVRVDPADGVTLSSIEVNAQGSAVAVLASVAPDSARGDRRVVLDGADHPYRPVSPGADRLAILDPAPRILSLAPRYVQRGTGPRDITIRGRHLADARSFLLNPGEGIAVGSAWSVNETGTEAEVRIDVAATAATGERVLIVESLTGNSGVDPNAANRLFITDSDPPKVRNLSAPALGVHIGEAADTGVVEKTAFGPQVGVVVGSSIHSLVPGRLETGSAAELMLTGGGLEGVDEIRVEPSDGISIGFLTVDPLGERLHLELDVADGAAPIWRQLFVSDGGVEVPFADAAESRILVTRPGPSIDGLAPRVIAVDAPQLTLVLVGRNLQGAEVVLASPPLLSLGLPSVSADGRRLEVSAKPVPGAEAGPVRIRVSTTGGVSSSSAMPESTIWLFADAKIPPSPVTAPAISVLVGEDVPSPGQSLQFASAPVGVSIGAAASSILPPRTIDAHPVGVAIGPVITEVEAPRLTLGTTHSLRLHGRALQVVDGFAVYPGMDLQVGRPTVSTDGTTLAVLLTIPDDADPLRRELRVGAGAMLVPFAPSARAVIDIDDGPPEIFSLDPIGATTGQTVTLVIRGMRLDDVERVFAEPSEGLVFSSLPRPAAEGDQVAIEVHIRADAEAGPRTLRIESPGGVSDERQRAANRFTIY